MSYKAMSTEDFNRILEEILSDYRGNQLLDIPGFYEIVSEYFNNDVLELWEEEQDS